MALSSLQDLIDGLADDAEAPALIGHRRRGGAVSWTRGELRQRIEDAAAGLANLGVGPEVVVGIWAPYRPEWVIALLAVVRVGAIALPLAESIGERELCRVLEHSGCRFLITTPRLWRRLTQAEVALPPTPILLDGAAGHVEGAHRLADLEPARPRETPPAEPDRVAILVYTSGTTGTPKGVPLSHANLAANVNALLATRLAGRGDRVLLPLPLHHVYPLTVGVLAVLATGAALVLPAGITAPEIARAMAQSRCTIMIGVPRLYEAMLSGVHRRLGARSQHLEAACRRLLDLVVAAHRRTGWNLGRILFWPLRRMIGPDLRLLASGGARLDPAMGRRLQGLGFDVLTGYGLSETAPILTFDPPGRPRIDSAGLPVEGVELRIEPVPDAPEGQGEILARGPNVFRGYWANPEATKEAFADDGFFRTGDLGYLDGDGYLHVVGRSKELIVLAGGKNVFPEEVEALYQASPLIAEIAALERDGRLVGLAVPEAEAGDGEERARAVRSEVGRLGQDVPSYERLADVALTDEPLPRTQIGKLRRHLLPELFEQARSGAIQEPGEAEVAAADRALLDDPTVDRVWSWLGERFAGRRLTMDTSPQMDLGLDSFDWMSLAMELQERFRVRLDEDAVARVTTLRDLLHEVEAAAEESPEEEPAPAETRLLEPPGWAARLGGRLLGVLNRALMRALFQVRAEGLEHLPERGPFLLAPNHASYLDPFAIGAVWPAERRFELYWAGWTGLLFRGPLTRAFSRIARVLPVDPERGLTSTLPLARAALEQGRVLVWFPEGGRSADGRLQRFLPGAGLLLLKTGVPAVPAHVEGSFEAWPPGRRWPRLHPIRIRFGAPLGPQRIADEEANQRAQETADRLREAVAALGAHGEGEGCSDEA